MTNGDELDRLLDSPAADDADVSAFLNTARHRLSEAPSGARREWHLTAIHAAARRHAAAPRLSWAERLQMIFGGAAAKAVVTGAVAVVAIAGVAIGNQDLLGTFDPPADPTPTEQSTTDTEPRGPVLPPDWPSPEGSPQPEEPPAPPGGEQTGDTGDVDVVAGDDLGDDAPDGGADEPTDQEPDGQPQRPDRGPSPTPPPSDPSPPPPPFGDDQQPRVASEPEGVTLLDLPLDARDGGSLLSVDIALPRLGDVVGGLLGTGSSEDRPDADQDR